VIKAAAAAAAEPGPEQGKVIAQRHFDSAAQDVLKAKNVMQQSLFTDADVSPGTPVGVWQTVEAQWRTAMLVTLGLAGGAFVIALVAIALVLLR
jgi:hypothetical protein